MGTDYSMGLVSSSLEGDGGVKALCKLRVARVSRFLLWHAKITGEQARPGRHAVGQSKIVEVASAP